MARCIRHDPCPECGSRDNVGVYDDGSRFCFGCHWWTPPEGAAITDRIHRLLTEAEPVDRLGEEFVERPPDYTMEIPDKAFTWVRQYINGQEIMEHLIGWSPSLERLIFPVYNSAHELLMWSGRYFGDKPDKYSKWYIQGRKSEHIDLLSSNVLSPRVVFVEDRVSAIKVSRLVSSVCIYGTKIPLEHAKMLSKAFSEAVIWLDSDKRREAVIQATQLSNLFKQVKVVFSDKDPKCYENSEILGFLGVA